MFSLRYILYSVCGGGFEGSDKETFEGSEIVHLLGVGPTTNIDKRAQGYLRFSWILLYTAVCVLFCFFNLK